jgi:hypothetical protein
MDYPLVIRALERHVGICERSVQFFRERRMGMQFKEGIALLEEATRALLDLKRARDIHYVHKGVAALGLEDPPPPSPPDTPGPAPASTDFPDEPLVDAPLREQPDASPLKPV